MNKQKKHIIAISLSSLILFSSCKSAVIASHSDVMNTYNNERQVVEGFGLPNNEIKSNGVKQWYYDYGTVSRTSTYNPTKTATSTATYNPYSDKVTVKTEVNSTVGSSSTSTYDKYVKFLIDEQTNRVISWHSQGVNYEKIDKKQRLKNILYPSLTFIAGFVIYMIIDSRNSEKQLNQEDYDYYND